MPASVSRATAPANTNTPLIVPPVIVEPDIEAAEIEPPVITGASIAIFADMLSLVNEIDEI